MKEEDVLVVELVKKWILDNNAAYLAKDDIVVHWGKPTSSVDEDDWIKWSMKETVSILRMSIIPFGLMKFLTSSIVALAATECDRAFITGVHSEVKTLPQIFNYNTETLVVSVKTMDYKLEIMSRLIKVLEKTFRNWLITDVGLIYENCFNYVSQPVPSRNMRNKYLRAVLAKKGCSFRERPYKNRYKWNNRYHVIIQHETGHGLDKVNEEEIELFVKQTLRGSTAAERFATAEQKISLGVGITSNIPV